MSFLSRLATNATLATIQAGLHNASLVKLTKHYQSLSEATPSTEDPLEIAEIARLQAEIAEEGGSRWPDQDVRLARIHSKTFHM
jgi:hypothetical protein